MSQAVSTVQFDTEAAKRQVIYYATKYRAVIFAVAMVVLFLAISQIADAGTTTDEFSASAGKFEGWIKGNLGKAISFVALIIGAGIAAFKKDGMVLVFSVFIAIGIGIITSIINASFTALI